MVDSMAAYEYEHGDNLRKNSEFYNPCDAYQFSSKSPPIMERPPFYGKARDWISSMSSSVKDVYHHHHYCDNDGQSDSYTLPRFHLDAGFDVPPDQSWIRIENAEVVESARHSVSEVTDAECRPSTEKNDCLNHADLIHGDQAFRDNNTDGIDATESTCNSQLDGQENNDQQLSQEYFTSFPCVASTLPAQQQNGEQLALLLDNRHFNSPNSSSSSSSANNMPYLTRSLRYPSVRCPKSRGTAPLTKEEQRMNACRRERIRMKAMNLAFDALRQKLPFDKPRGRKFSKIEALRSAIKYISMLNDILNSSNDRVSANCEAQGWHQFHMMGALIKKYRNVFLPQFKHLYSENENLSVPTIYTPSTQSSTPHPHPHPTNGDQISSPWTILDSYAFKDHFAQSTNERHESKQGESIGHSSEN